jgi:hypothetical protein
MNIEEIASQLNARKQRATYGAVAGLVGTSPRDLMSGRPREQLYSWIVAGNTAAHSRRGWPTGYAIDQIHPDCLRQIREGLGGIIQDAEILKRWLTGEPVDAPGARLRVFLCHSSEDKAVVRMLFGRLRADGFAPWLDEENILPGQDWDSEIRRAVRASHVVVVCLSASSVTKEGYVQREIGLALGVADEKPAGTIFVIPARLAPCQVPERFAKWHWVNLFDARGYEQLAAALHAREVQLQSRPSAPP